MFHVRFTPYDISGYTFDFLVFYDKYIIARELYDDEGEPLLHYHILVDDSELGIQTLRNAVKANFKIPPAGKGKNNRYYAIFDDWKDPGYICKYDDIIRQKGYSEKQVLDYVISGKKKYLDKVKEGELRGEEAPAPLSPKKEKVVKLPFQQAVIASAAADWYNYKRQCSENDEVIDKNKTIDFVVSAMREHGKGINQYLVTELARAVLYDDLDYRENVLNKIKCFANL